MDRRWNWFFIIPLVLAPLAYWVTGDTRFLWLGLVIGMAMLLLFRRLALPPHLNAAIRQYRRGNLEQAMVLADRSIARRPARWEPFHLRSLIHFANSRLADAESDARQVIALKPSVYTGYTALAQALYAQARFDEARDAYQEALRRYPRDELNHFYLGITLYRLGQYDEAAQALTQALKMGLNNQSLRLLGNYYLGDSLERLGRDDEAAEAHARLVENKAGLEPLRADLLSVSNYPALPQLQKDIYAVAQRLRQLEGDEAADSA